MVGSSLSKAIRGEFRKEPEIGSELDEHSQVAGRSD